MCAASKTVLTTTGGACPQTRTFGVAADIQDGRRHRLRLRGDGFWVGVQLGGPAGLASSGRSFYYHGSLAVAGCRRRRSAPSAAACAWRWRSPRRPAGAAVATAARAWAAATSRRCAAGCTPAGGGTKHPKRVLVLLISGMSARMPDAAISRQQAAAGRGGDTNKAPPRGAFFLTLVLPMLRCPGLPGFP